MDIDVIDLDAPIVEVPDKMRVPLELFGGLPVVAARADYIAGQYCVDPGAPGLAFALGADAAGHDRRARHRHGDWR